MVLYDHACKTERSPPFAQARFGSQVLDRRVIGPGVIGSEGEVNLAPVSIYTHSTERLASSPDCSEGNVPFSRGLSTSALATGMIEASRGDHKGRYRAFFDVGSQKTFVSRKVVDELGIQSHDSIGLSLSGFNKTNPFQHYEVVELEVRMGNQRSNITAIVWIIYLLISIHQV